MKYWEYFKIELQHILNWNQEQRVINGGQFSMLCTKRKEISYENN